jgi:alpha-D-xyloside xylohydrolase
MNSGNKRDVYLPDGTWVNFFSGEVTEGNCWLNNFYCPLDEMPVWVRKDATVPVYPLPVKSTDDMNFDSVVNIVFDRNYMGVNTSAIGELLKAD